MFIATVTAKKGSTIGARVFDPGTGKWWGVTGWVDTEDDALVTTLGVIPLQNTYEDRYCAQIPLPSGGPYLVEYIDLNTMVVVAEDSTVFVTPEYNGPVTPIPSPPDPTLQTIYGYAKLLGVDAAEGDVVTVIPDANQVVSGSIISTEPRTTSVDANKVFSIMVDKGSVITLTIGSYFSHRFTVSIEDTEDVKNYLS